MIMNFKMNINMNITENGNEYEPVHVKLGLTSTPELSNFELQLFNKYQLIFPQMRLYQIHQHIHTHSYTCIHTHTYTHTCIHTFLHTCIHMCGPLHISEVGNIGKYFNKLCAPCD